LLPAAVNQALAKAKELHVEAMRSLTEGVDMPDMSSLLSQLSGGDPGKPPA
jgi:DNA-binding protein YbaB